MKRNNSLTPAPMRWLVFMLVLTAIGSISWKMFSPPASALTGAVSQKPGVDAKADKLLKQMSDYLTGLQQFSYKSAGMYEEVDKNNKKQKINYNAEVFIMRPNKLRANVTGDRNNGSVYYDGKLFSVMGTKENLYAQTNAPGTLDEALDMARDQLQLDPPGADLIYTDPYTGLMEQVEKGRYVGEAVINGTPCHHLSYISKEVDWQIWIEKGQNPLPRKYLIISRTIPGKPEFKVEFSDWKINGSAPANDMLFAFSPPKDAQKIEFMKVAELKATKNQKK